MTLCEFEHIPIKDNGEPLADISNYPFILEHAYFQMGFSPDPRLFARQTVADKLVAIQDAMKMELNSRFGIHTDSV
jgi:hypothetical protein